MSNIATLRQVLHEHLNQLIESMLVYADTTKLSRKDSEGKELDLIRHNLIDDFFGETNKDEGKLSLLDSFLPQWAVIASDRISKFIHHIIKTCVNEDYQKAVMDRLTNHPDFSITNWHIQIISLCAVMEPDENSSTFKLSAYESQWRKESGNVIWSFLENREYNAEKPFKVLSCGSFSAAFCTAFEFPRDAAVNDVLEWVQQGSDKSAQEWANWLISQKDWQPLKVKFENNEKSFSMQVDLNSYRIIAYALIYLAEKNVTKEAFAKFTAIPAGNNHSMFIASMASLPKDEMRHRGEKNISVPEIDGKIELISPNPKKPIQLTLPIDEFNERMISAIHSLRGSFGLRNWAAILNLFSQEGSRTGRVKWTLDDHLLALGKPDWRRKPHKRDEISKLIEFFTKCELVIYGSDNKIRARTPLLHIVDGIKIETKTEEIWSVGGMILQISPLIYEGVRNTSNKQLGKDWFPQTPRIAEIDHTKYPYAITLGLILPIRWRWRIGELFNQGTAKDEIYIDIKAANLLSAAGINWKQNHQERVWERLELNLDKLIEVGGLKAYQWLGQKNRRECLLRLYAPQKANDHLLNSVPFVESTPPFIPKTGTDLKIWRKSYGFTQEELAENLNLGVATIKRAEALKEEIISKTITDKIKDRVQKYQIRPEPGSKSIKLGPSLGQLIK